MKWLHAMSDAASEKNMTIQYCMTELPHLLGSTELAAVSQARASGDYSPGSSQWRIGPKCLLYHAIGIYASKDTFFTNETQLGCPRAGSDCIEPDTDLHALMALHSLGPFGPGDRLHWSNKTVIMRSCRSDGLLLRPDTPMIPLESTWSQAFGTRGGGVPTVWASHTTIGSLRFASVLSTESNYAVAPCDLLLAGDGCAMRMAAYDVYQTRLLSANVTCAAPLGLTPSTKSASGSDKATPFALVAFAEVADNGFALLGEQTKFCMVSSQRVRDIDSSSPGQLTATLTGVEGDAPVMVVLHPDSSLTTTTCTFGAATATLVLTCSAQACTCE